MRSVSVEAWDCGDCGAGVNADTSFAWCDGCSKVLCVSCLDVSTTCADCDTIVCRHCTIRLFAVDCAGCGFALHVDCSARQASVKQGEDRCVACCSSAPLSAAAAM